MMTTGEYLLRVGISPDLRGFDYIIKGVELLQSKLEYYRGATVKRLYTDIACTFNTTASRVERGIRHAIEAGWSRAGALEWEALGCANTVRACKGVPTNSQLLYTLVYLLNKD